jgi:hypothetical protein
MQGWRRTYPELHLARTRLAHAVKSPCERLSIIGDNNRMMLPACSIYAHCAFKPRHYARHVPLCSIAKAKLKLLYDQYQSIEVTHTQRTMEEIV